MKKDSEPIPAFTNVIDLTDGGLARIKKAEDSSGQVVILKLYHRAGSRVPLLNLGNYRCEVAALSRLSHPSIIRLHAFCEDWIYRSPHGVDYNSLLIELEHCPHGDLFDMISRSGRFSEALARSYFRQLLDAVGSCHEAGIIHRDLKPENLLLGEDFELKLADFGSAFVPGVEPCEIFGTTSYLPPEGSANPFAPAIDLYSCGIVLYFMLTRELPFAKPTQQDLRYKLFQSNRNIFWGAKTYLSSTTRNLIEALMHENPNIRLTLSQALAHPWLAEAQLTPDEVRREMVARKARIP